MTFAVEYIADKRLAGVRLGVLLLDQPRVGPTTFSFERHEAGVFDGIRKRRTPASLGEDPVLKSFRELYWSFGMDPTKLRVSSEALLRRILKGDNLWRVNNTVDAVNLASAETGLPVSLWDLSQVKLPLAVRIAAKGEMFHRIGLDPEACAGTELVVADQEKILTLGFATADSELCKVTPDTESALVALYATKAVSDAQLLDAMKRVKQRLEEFAEGSVKRLGVFSQATR